MSEYRTAHPSPGQVLGITLACATTANLDWVFGSSIRECGEGIKAAGIVPQAGAVFCSLTIDLKLPVVGGSRGAYISGRRDVEG